MRATALDQEAALADGHRRAHGVRLAGASPGPSRPSAACFLAARQGSGGFDVGLGQSALLAFPAIILGGLDSIPGAVVGGVLIGLTYGYARATNFVQFVGRRLRDRRSLPRYDRRPARPALRTLRLAKGRAGMSTPRAQRARRRVRPTASARHAASSRPVGRRRHPAGPGLSLRRRLLVAILDYHPGRWPSRRLALNVLSGYAGQISLGITFFMGIGAYTAALLGGDRPMHSGDPVGLALPFVIWLPASGIVAALVGALVGPVALRLKGFYLGIVTLALVFIGQYLFKQRDLRDRRRRRDARSRAKHRRLVPSPARTRSSASADVEPGVLSSAGAHPGARALFVANVMRSRAGRAFQAVRDNEAGAAIMGVNIFQAKMGAFILSSFLAGIAGAL